MFKPENKIIIVDDMQDHIDTLIKPFKENGIGCTGFLYDVGYSNPLNTVKVAFFDIGINPNGGGSKSQRLNSIAHAIQQYIAPDNGPFVLIFWTNRKSEIEDIKAYIQSHYPNNFPKPFIVDCINKDYFLNSHRRLTNKLNKILENPTLKMLFQFEESTAKAASATVSQLFDIIPGTDNWGVTKDFQKNFEKIFSKIAVQNLGYNNAKLNPDKGIISSLTPVLGHHLENSLKGEEWRSYLKTLAKSKSIRSLTYPKNFDADKLNTIFHIHRQEFIEKDVRGAVINIDPSTFQENFGCQYSEWFNNFLNGVKKTNRDNSRLIAVEISASCDYAQKKKRLNKYMLGVLLPAEALKSVKRDRRPEYLFILDGVFSIDSKVKICLNLNFVFSAMKEDTRLGDSIFIIKKELMDQIGNRYANHISRIGITSF